MCRSWYAYVHEYMYNINLPNIKSRHIKRLKIIPIINEYAYPIQVYGSSNDKESVVLLRL